MLSAVFRLSFLTDQSRIATVRVSRANENVTPLEINSAMDKIIESDAFDTKGRGNIILKDSAQLVITTVKQFDV